MRNGPENEKGEKLVKADTDNYYYRREDVYWICPPTEDDPGVIAPKDGAEPQEKIY